MRSIAAADLPDQQQSSNDCSAVQNSAVQCSDVPSSAVHCSVVEICGGCPQLLNTRRDELRYKADNVEHALKEAGVWAKPVEVRTDGMRVGYRNRIRMKIDAGVAGFFNSSKRHGCPVLRPELWEAISKLVQVTAQAPRLLGSATHLEVRVGDRPTPEGAVFGLLITTAAATDTPNIASLSERLGPAWTVACAARNLHRMSTEAGEGPSVLRYDVPQGNYLDVPTEAFVQVNSAVNQMLVTEFLAAALGTAPSSFIDLFSGAGNFSVGLLTAGLKGVAVENNVAALDTLAARFGADKLTCLTGDAPTLLPKITQADVVIANPPRAGLKGGHRLVAQLTGQRLILVSCNPHTLARDCATMIQHGFAATDANAFDMFPGTNHIETMVVLDRV